MDTHIEQVISELSKIDSATENIFEQSEVEKENYHDDIMSQIKDFDDSLSESINSKLMNYESSLREEYDKQLNRHKSASSAELSKMNDAFAANHTKWAGEILDELTKE